MSKKTTPPASLPPGPPPPPTAKRWGGNFRVVRAANELGEVWYGVEEYKSLRWNSFGWVLIGPVFDDEAAAIARADELAKKRYVVTVVAE